MKQILLAAAVIAPMLALPALAQSSRNLDRAPYAAAASDRIHRDRAISRRAVRRAPSSGYAQKPRDGNSADRPFGGYRWPGARYDANGYYIDPNSPGRW